MQCRTALSDDARAGNRYCQDHPEAHSFASMKRVAWLLLAVFCTVLVQVQPAEAQVAKAKACACCQHPGACAMPCCSASPSVSTALALAPSGRVARSPLLRRAEPLRGVMEIFSTSFVATEAVRPALPASAEAALAAGVPLFKAHCSFLI
jgi:hypothetical protein